MPHPQQENRTPSPSYAATEVEAALYTHPAVHQAAVFGVPNRVMGELVAAAVTLRPEAQVGQVHFLPFHSTSREWCTWQQ